MAQNVDLIVVGTAEELSATELTQRLIAEFGQSGDAFIDLVAAACLGASPYTAQTKVSLDTAVEGQMQLEKLGVVCQVVMDGKVMGESAPAKPEVKPVLEEKPTPVEPAEPETIESVEQAESLAPIDPAPDVVAQPAKSTSLSAGEDVSFGDELDSFADFEATDGSVTEINEDPDQQPEQQQSAESSVESDGVSFDDELGSLDEDAKKTRQKVKEQAAKSAAEPEPEVASPSDVEDGESDAPAAELVLDTDDLESSAADSEKSDAKAAVESGADDELVLSLSVDDLGPLTKPKEKSGKVADDGGLTLSLDDSTPLAAPKKGAAEAQPEALKESISVDESPAAEAKAQPPEAAVEIPEPVTVAQTKGVEKVTAVEEARDTSRELKEEDAPIVDEPEHDDPSSANDPDGGEAPQPDKEKPVSDIGVKSIDDAAPVNATAPVVETTKQQPATAPAEAQSSQPATASEEAQAPQPEPEVFVAHSLNNLINDLSANSGSDSGSDSGSNIGSISGGLVLPGQVAAETSEFVEEVGSQPEAPEESPEVPMSGSASAAEELVEKSTYREVNITVEGEGKAKLIKTAVAASVVAGLLGAGAMFVVNGGLGTEPVTPVVAQIVPVNENSAFDAVEEVSLKAALERSSDINNPNNYSTEELIAYLQDDLGENASQELQNYVSGDGVYEVSQSVPRMGAAIPADSNSVLWLKNRVAHNADRYFDEWTKREVDLQAYMELHERLIEVGDLEIARDVSGSTKDKLFAVMSLQRLARSYSELGDLDKASQLLDQASRSTYGITSEAERTIAIADYALSEKALGQEEDSLDSFLKASILARSLNKPENRTVALSAIAVYFQSAGRIEDMADFLELAMVAAYELPVNTAARDLAIRHVALTEVSLGLTAQATEHANLIVDPFAAVSALHGIALELERIGDSQNARLTLNMAYRAGSLIKNSEKRDTLLEKIKLGGGK